MDRAAPGEELCRRLCFFLPTVTELSFQLLITRHRESICLVRVIR